MCQDTESINYLFTKMQNLVSTTFLFHSLIFVTEKMEVVTKVSALPNQHALMERLTKRSGTEAATLLTASTEAANALLQS